MGIADSGNNTPTPESTKQNTGQFPIYIQKQIKEMAENLGKQLKTQNSRNNGFELENSIMKQVEERRKNGVEKSPLSHQICGIMLRQRKQTSSSVSC